MKRSVRGALRREAQARPTLVLHHTHNGRTLVCHWQQRADGRLSCLWGIEVQPPPFLPKYAFSAKVRDLHPAGVGIASRRVEIPLVDGNGQISGVLCQSMPPSGVRGAFVSRGPGETRAIEDVAQLVVHDINNFLAVIGSGLRLLEGQSDSADRTVIVVKMQQAISRGALLSRHLLEAARPCPDFMDAGTLDQCRSPPICGTSTPTRKNCISHCSTSAATRSMLRPTAARSPSRHLHSDKIQKLSAMDFGPKSKVQEGVVVCWRASREGALPTSKQIIFRGRYPVGWRTWIERTEDHGKGPCSCIALDGRTFGAAPLISSAPVGRAGATDDPSPSTNAIADSEGALRVPADYRSMYEYLGTWAIAADQGPGSKQLHSVYASPGAVTAFRTNGHFPDGAVLVKEGYETATSPMTTGTVSHAETLAGWFVMVKDSKNSHPQNKLWGSGWAWSWFDAVNPLKTTSTDYTTDCQPCHIPAQSTDWIYTQGYPVLHK